MVSFTGDNISGFDLIPTIVDRDGTVSLAQGEEKDEILYRVEQLSEDLLAED